MSEAPITRTTRLRWHPDALFRNLEGEAVLLGGEVAQYYGLDPVGTRIWELIGEQPDIDGVVRAIVKEYDIGEPQALEDLFALVEDLVKHRLIEVVSDA